MSRIDGTHQLATAVSVGETRILMLSRADVDQMSTNQPHLALAFTKLVAEAIAPLRRPATGALVDHLEPGYRLDAVRAPNAAPSAVACAAPSHRSGTTPHAHRRGSPS